MEVASGPAAVLADWAASAQTATIPPHVRQRTAQLLLDAVASALAGRHGDETGQVEAVAREIAGGNDATVIGGRPLSRIGAALVNGYQVTAVTVCDVYRPALCHVTPEVVPPAIAAAEGRGVSGSDLITALAVGLETTVRIGRGIGYSSFRERGWHSPGVIGPFGGAAAVGRILGLDPQRMRWAFGLAGSQSAGTFAHWGTPTIKFHQARGAVSGLIAATLANQGFRSSEEVLGHPDGGILTTYSDGGDPEAIVADLGEEWELERISMRLWPAASSIQSAISAVFDLIKEHDITPDVVSRLTISLSETTYGMHGEMGWETRFKALLSARYTAAVVLHDRECWLDQFDAVRISDPIVDGFARNRITVVSDHSVPTTGAVADVELLDGRRYTARRDVPKGDAADPLSTAEVAGKFQRAVSGLVPPARAEEALTRLLEIDEVDDVGRVMSLLGRGP
jgi:2-methylcitrate dehydratase PrpD